MTVILWIFLGLAALYLLAGCVIAMLACRRFAGAWNPMKGLTHATEALLAPYGEIIGAGRDWLINYPHVPVEMTSFDGLTLRASLYEHPAPKAVLVACHGYRSDGVRDFASAMHFYHSYGMSILLIDQRASGRSDGRYITFGVRESVDIRDWCRLMQERYPELPILPAGISMGAGAVLMTADDLPSHVPALLADCGFDSPLEEFRFVARRYMMPLGPLMVPGVDLFCRVLAGFGLGERSASDALSRCTLPVFFVHGEADGLVPYGDTLKNAAACAGPAEVFSVPGAEHGISYLVDREGYHKAVDGFLRRYVFKE